MSAREDLEAALRASWDREHLVGYADALIAEGDPRGELISYDLLKPPDATLDPVREELIARWLGDDLVECAYRVIRDGFIDMRGECAHDKVDMRGDSELELLVARASPFIRDFGIAGAPEDVTRVIEQLAQQPQPWLFRLSIVALNRAIPPALVGRLIDATPALAELVLSGQTIVDEFPHPRLYSLHVSGCSAIGVTAGTAQQPVQAACLDLVLQHSRMFRTEPVPTGLRPELFPRLAELDVSRNHSAETDPRADVFTFLARSRELCARLETLRLPPIRRADQYQTLANLLPAMSGAASVEVTGGFRDLDPRTLDPRVRAPAPVLWSGDLAPGAAWRLGDLQRSAAHLCDDLLRTYDELTAPVRAAWSQLWDAYERISPGESIDVATTDVATAFASIGHQQIVELARHTTSPTMSLQAIDGTGY